jgi:hypothetical protein
MTNFYPNYLNVPSNKPLAYLLEFGLLTQFGRPFVDDKLNCEASIAHDQYISAYFSTQYLVWMGMK